MFLNSKRSSYHRKVYILSYTLEDYSKEKLSKDLEEQLKDVKVLLIAEYSSKINSTILNSGNIKKFLVYLELGKSRQLSKENTFEIEGVKPFLEEYTRNKAWEKIKEKDTDPYEKGIDLNAKLKAVKDKKKSIYAENIHKLKNGQITCKQIREKDPVDWSNNKRKYREFEAEERSIRKKRRIQQGIMPPSKFKMIPMTVIVDKSRTDLIEILKFYNYRLVEQDWVKEASGMVIWSRKKSLGKTELINMLLSIDPNIFEWDKNDRGWQSTWDKNKDYSAVVFNAINSGKHVPFNVFEDFGDRKSKITVNKKYDAEPDYISSRTPWILTSNKRVRELYKDKDYEVITERCVEVELKGDLFELINIIADYNGVERLGPKREYVLKDIYYQPVTKTENLPSLESETESAELEQIYMEDDDDQVIYTKEKKIESDTNPLNPRNLKKALSVKQQQQQQDVSSFEEQQELEDYIYMEEDDSLEDTQVNFTSIWDLDDDEINDEEE